MIFSSILSILEVSANSFPNKTAIVYREKKMTYKELLTASKKIAFFLASRFKQSGSVAIFMENSPAWLIAYFGIMASGRTCVPLSLRSSDRNLVLQASLSDAKVVIVSEKFYEKWQKLTSDFRKPPVIIKFEKMYSLSNKNLEFKFKTPKFPVTLFTSGTTSAPKAISLTQINILAATRNIIDYLKPIHDDVYYAQLPFYHSFGLGNIHIILAVGGTMIISDAGIDLKKVLRDIVKHRATFWAATPYTLSLISGHFLKDFIRAGKFLRKICTNTGPMPVETTRIILKNLPITQFFTYYGLTEASRSSFLHYNLYPDKLDSVGKPSPNVSICIVNKNNKSLPVKNTGEICIKGGHVVGSLNNGWLHTGDIGYFDEDGFLYVIGRKDDVVNIGGEKFSLKEVDRVLLSCDGVKDAASFVAKSSRMDFIVGCVVPTLNTNHSEEDLKQELLAVCKKKLDRYQIPAQIIFLDSIPRTDNGKTRRNFLKSTYS